MAILVLPAAAQQQDRRNSYGGRIEWFENLVSEDKGGVEGTVVNRSGRAPVADALLNLWRGDKLIAEARVAGDGYFIFDNLPNGEYRLAVSAPGFMSTEVNVSVEGFVKDLIFVSMVSSTIIPEFDESSFVEFDMEDSGYDDAPSLLYCSFPPVRQRCLFEHRRLWLQFRPLQEQGIRKRVSGCVPERSQDE